MNSKSLYVLYFSLSLWHDKSVCTFAKPSVSPLHLSPHPRSNPARPHPISQSQTHLIWGVITGADLWKGVERSDCCAPLSTEDEIEENSAQETPYCYRWLPRVVPSSKCTTVPTGS